MMQISLWQWEMCTEEDQLPSLLSLSLFYLHIRQVLRDAFLETSPSLPLTLRW